MCVALCTCSFFCSRERVIREESVTYILCRTSPVEGEMMRVFKTNVEWASEIQLILRSIPISGGPVLAKSTTTMDGNLLRSLPDHLTTKLFTYFGFKDYALTGCASQYAQAHWQTANRRKPMPLYVPEDCKTLKEAVQRVEHDSRIMTIVLGEGEHVVKVSPGQFSWQN